MAGENFLTTSLAVCHPKTNPNGILHVGTGLWTDLRGFPASPLRQVVLVFFLLFFRLSGLASSASFFRSLSLRAGPVSVRDPVPNFARRPSSAAPGYSASPEPLAAVYACW